MNSLVGSYTVAGGECRRKIEYAVKYGKPLENFYGIKELLSEVKKDAADIEAVRIVLPDGKVIYDLNGKATGTLSPKMLREVDFRSNLNGQPHILVRHEGKYALFLPIQDRQNNWIGSLNLVFDEVIVNSRVNVLLNQNMKDMLMVALLAAVLLGIVLSAAPVVSQSGEIRSKRIFAILLVILGAAQLYYGFVNITMFQKVYIDIARENTQLSARIIQKDINQVVQKGVSYAEMEGVNAWFDNIIRMVKETGRVSIHDAQGRVLYSASSPGLESDSQQPDPDYIYTFPLDRSLTGEAGTLQIVLSKAYVELSSL